MKTLRWIHGLMVLVAAAVAGPAMAAPQPGDKPAAGILKKEGRKKAPARKKKPVKPLKQAQLLVELPD